ncbi:hypothetical protein [Nocardioides sp.]|uniref:hypothetical protein n=1 Tax=Nocardioides sp. TaxID=35761 RepID=UPI002724C87C|nr:hypothetical protein [Nocardioides sp.]MDO9457959.1 hypothetical protein [Nocardioides sp.]
MSRPLRLLALSTAIAVAWTTAPVAAFADSTVDVPDAASRAPASQARGTDAPAAYPALDTQVPDLAVDGVSAERRGQQGTSARPVSKKWPVRQRVGSATYHPVTPSGDLSQRFVRATMVQDRLYGEIYVDVTLQGTPTEATDSRLRVGFGVIRNVSGTPTCVTGPGSTDADRHSYGTDPDNYSGTRIRYAAKLAGAKRGKYNCGFAIMLSPDGATVYDAVTDSVLIERRQKPILGFKITGKRINNRSFTRVPVRIVNSRYTVATATKVRLTVRSRGVAVRYNPRVGKIKPGQVRRGAIFVKVTGRGNGSITLIARSKDYRKKITVRVTAR